MVTRLRLPSPPPDLLHVLDATIASEGPRPSARHGGGPLRGNDDLRTARARRRVDRDHVVGGSRGDACDLAIDDEDQIDRSRGVVDTRIGEGLRHNHTRPVDTEMELCPPTLAVSPVCRGGPRAVAHDRQAGALDDAMDGARGRDATEHHSALLTPPQACGVVRRVHSCAPHGQDRPHEPFVWRTGKPKTSRTINAVSSATAENCYCPPGRPEGDSRHASVASAEGHRVRSPRWTSARS